METATIVTIGCEAEVMYGCPGGPAGDAFVEPSYAPCGDAADPYWFTDPWAGKHGIVWACPSHADHSLERLWYPS